MALTGGGVKPHRAEFMRRSSAHLPEGFPGGVRLGDTFLASSIHHLWVAGGRPMACVAQW